MQEIEMSDHDVNRLRRLVVISEKLERRLPAIAFACNSR
jgi:hypothetical protein